MSPWFSGALEWERPFLPEFSWISLYQPSFDMKLVSGDVQRVAVAHLFMFSLSSLYPQWNIFHTRPFWGGWMPPSLSITAFSWRKMIFCWPPGYNMSEIFRGGWLFLVVGRGGVGSLLINLSSGLSFFPTLDENFDVFLKNLFHETQHFSCTFDSLSHMSSYKSLLISGEMKDWVSPVMANTPSFPKIAMVEP